jgi:outer membrane protein assembly factor BamE (lipoprotein component of BamABCDE complex)
MFFNFKNHFKKFIYIYTLVILSNCQLQEPLKPHGIIFLENRSEKLVEKKSNKNDVVRIMGRPQIIDEETNNTWIYIERILSKGKYHKLGQHVLKENNVLVLDFDKYGVLVIKKILTKEDMKKVKFSKKNTENELSQKSFVQSFLESIKQKMYSNRK